nr:hypothetical protein GCM10020093_066330 [Planobispora longispora]
MVERNQPKGAVCQERAHRATRPAPPPTAHPPPDRPAPVLPADAPAPVPPPGRPVPDEQQRTRFLLEVGARLSASLNLHRCARTAVELVVPFLADAALIVLPPGAAGRSAWLRAADDRSRPQEGVITAAEASTVPGLAEALTGFPPAPSRWLDPAQAPGWLLPEGYGPAGHLLVTPLPGNGVAAGALVLARRIGTPSFEEETEALVRVFAARVGAAISAALLYQEQSSVNQVLTTGLLPPPLPELDGVELAGSLRASQKATRIGGDFYDVYLPGPARNGPAGDDPADQDGAAALVALGDVCGKEPRPPCSPGRSATPCGRSCSSSGAPNGSPSCSTASSSASRRPAPSPPWCWRSSAPPPDACGSA